MLGLSAQHLDHNDQAAAYFQQALNLNPNDPWATELLTSLKPNNVSLAPQ
jgi:Tfp pilus assembly protein PilF